VHEERRESKRQDGDEEKLPIRDSLALQAANRRQSPLFAGSKRTAGRLANAPMENRFSGSQERLLSGDLSSAQNR